MRRLLTLSLVVSLGACVAGPPPEIATPVPELPQDFAYKGDAATNTSVADLLPAQDPAYQTLSSAALAEGPTLAEAIARVEAARAGARGAGAQRLPNVSAEGSVTGTRINPNQFGDGAAAGGFIDTEQVSYGANLVTSWDPDLFGRLKAQERAALARIDSASASASAVRIALLAEIAGSVTDWRVLEARGEAIQGDVEAATQLAGLAKKREDAGIAPGFDRVRAEAAASASRSRLAALNSERVRIVGRLITLTGQSAAEVNAALAEKGSSLRQTAAPASLPSDLLTNRPDVLAAASELAATDAELAAAASARFPRITLSGVIGLLAFNPSNLFDEDSIVGTLAANVAAPLLDFGRIEAEIDGAAANKKIAFAAYRGAVFQALGDAEAAYGLITASDAEAALAVQEQSELERAAKLADTRYRAGLSNFLEVLEARRAADASGERAAAALGRAQRARILLWQALGGDSSEG
ncbi:efflux transporter outer membrane subunit [Erythrobacter sp. F6033]|uniref:efflux transporter outer membrane subunit n=1 Tax=Erythrobacter sp. F6033 TaxID=2926401 RepID=UPI001FF4A1D5|nr:efflux transporter outer membrane subunit [Erythrobacter sp. F6033]MCK0127209.1 efflux transporter outer membrane subunit [Erythrobacter sp. F6033]